MKVEDLCKNVSQMGRNRAFSPLGHKRSLQERHGDRGFSKGFRRSLLGRHLSAMATESHKKQSGVVATWGRHGDLPCKWRPSALKAWSPLRVAMATLKVQVANSSLSRVATYGRHGDLEVASGDLYTKWSWSPLAK